MPSGCSITRDQSQQERQNDGPENCDQDAVYQTALARAEDVRHDESADNSANDAYDDVHQCTIAAALHDLAGQKTSDQTNDDPENNAMTYHKCSLPCRHAAVDVMQKGGRALFIGLKKLAWQQRSFAPLTGMEVECKKA